MNTGLRLQLTDIMSRINFLSLSICARAGERPNTIYIFGSP